jgi:hypothetical protein
MLIINGPRITDTSSGDTGQPLGQLEDPDGNIILVFALDPVTLAGVMQMAIGRIPLPPELLGGGALAVSAFDQHGQPTAYAYNPSPDERDKAEVALYQAKLGEWNTRAAAIRAAIELMVQKK